MRDPHEGMALDGTIQTGVSRGRVSDSFEPVLAAAVEAVEPFCSGGSLYVYGSVATGMAQPVHSDVDLLTVGIPPGDAAAMGRSLSMQFSDLCRAVEVAAAQPSDFSGDTDEAYGGRVFLRHYCAHVLGPNLDAVWPPFAADARAARGLNGDIADSARSWRAELSQGADPGPLARRIARKSLLAVAGLVSVCDHIWTTDRVTAAGRWAEVEPPLANNMRLLVAWSEGTQEPSRYDVELALDGVVDRIAASFERVIGLWNAAS